MKYFSLESLRFLCESWRNNFTDKNYIAKIAKKAQSHTKFLLRIKAIGVSIIFIRKPFTIKPTTFEIGIISYDTSKDDFAMYQLKKERKKERKKEKIRVRDKLGE